jgi:S-formylglutathione hydrolase
MGQWREHDATRLLEDGAGRGRYDQILVEQGMADNFMVGQLKPELLESACASAGQSLSLRRRDGYDHSYFFISSFISEHLTWHAERLS